MGWEMDCLRSDLFRVSARSRDRRPGRSRLLDGAEDLRDLAVEGGEVYLKHTAPGMEDHVDRCMKQGDVASHNLAHSSLDTIAVDSLSHDLAYSKTNARYGFFRVLRASRSKEIAHLPRELFATCLIDPLIVGVLAETEDEWHERIRMSAK